MGERRWVDAAPSRSVYPRPAVTQRLLRPRGREVGATRHTDQVDRLFVYGTLRHGESRWPLLEPLVTGLGEPDTAAGLVFSTGLGYPAAIFDRSPGERTGTIVGQSFTLIDARLEEALAILDQEEGTVGGLFRRVEIFTDSGFAAWGYEYGSGLELTPIASGDWLSRE